MHKRALLAFALAACSTPAPPPPVVEAAAPTLSCALESNLRSAGSEPVPYRIVNESNTKLSVNWLDFQGARKPYGFVSPGQTFTQPTFVGHAWVITTTGGDCVALGIAGRGDLRVDASMIPVHAPTTTTLGPPPRALGLDPFYEKYVDAGGIPVISSGRVSDRALAAGADIVNHMVRKRPEARAAIIAAHVRVAVMAPTEQTLDIPEHADLASIPTDRPGVDWNQRARGLGATLIRPATSCGEENLLCAKVDRYRGENILIHEFGHTVQEIGLASDRNFQNALERAYRAAMAGGLWRGTYAATNVHEYWAEGVQDWFDANLHDVFEHNQIHTRAQLSSYDAPLYALLAQVFEDDAWRYACP